MTLIAGPSACAEKPAARRMAGTVLVTDASKGSAVSIIRSLGRQGLHVIAADPDRRAAGLRSRYVSERFCYPAAAGDPEAAVAALLSAVRRYGVDLVIPVTDEVILPLSAARESFRPLCHLALPEQSALALVSDKQATLELAGRLGVPVPKTVVAAGPDDAAEAASVGWPAVLKPPSSRRLRDGRVDSFTVSYASGPRELASALRRAVREGPLLVQEYCPGEGHGVEVLAERGRVLAAFQHRRLHEVPVTGGASSLREGVPLDPVLAGYAARLMGALGWTGLAMVEFKLSAGGPRLMEVNGRVWGSLPLAVRSGMDFPSRLARLYLQPEPDEPGGDGPDTTYEVGARSRNLELEVLWVASVLAGRGRHPALPSIRRSEGLKAALRLPLPADGYDILSLDDLRPGLAELAKIVRKLGSKAVSRGA